MKRRTLLKNSLLGTFGFLVSSRSSLAEQGITNDTQKKNSFQ